MGASNWLYQVSYQENIGQALQDLRNQIFEEGKYYKTWDDELDENPPEPQTIEELLEINGTDGTHSIIDIEQVLDRPVSREEWQRQNDSPYSKWNVNMGVVSPVSSENLVKIFGTDKPTGADLKKVIIDMANPEKAGRRLLDDIEDILPGRYHGIHIILYKDNKHDEIFFCGFSGD